MKIQVSHYLTINDLWLLTKQKVKDFVSANYTVRFKEDIPLRFWLLPEDTRPNILINTLLTGCKANPTFTYKVFCDGECMDEEKRICDYDILPSSYIMV